jgi:drug/metabolite transporter (DMT)-like permease
MRAERRQDPAGGGSARWSGEAPLSPAFVLLVAVLAMSWSGPLVRFSAAPALAVAAWRLIFSVALIAVVLLFRPGSLGALRRLTRREFGLAFAAGAFLAAHFWVWIASLELTTVANSVVLVSTQPIFVAAFSVVFLRERPDRWQWAGILLAIAGAVVVGWGGLGRGGAALRGDLLALSGAVLAASYYTIGRGLRVRFDLWAYIALVYGIAALLLLLAAAAHPDVPLTGYPPRDWLIFLALAAGPMMLGHTGVNYALRYVPAFVANLAVLGEPVGAALIAWLLPAIAETPPVQTLVGGSLVLGGILLGTRRRRGADDAVASGPAGRRSG